MMNSYEIVTEGEILSLYDYKTQGSKALSQDLLWPLHSRELLPLTHEKLYAEENGKALFTLANAVYLSGHVSKDRFDVSVSEQRSNLERLLESSRLLGTPQITEDRNRHTLSFKNDGNVLGRMLYCMGIPSGDEVPDKNEGPFPHYLHSLVYEVKDRKIRNTQLLDFTSQFVKNRFFMRSQSKTRTQIPVLRLDSTPEGPQTEAYLSAMAELFNKAVPMKGQFCSPGQFDSRKHHPTRSTLMKNEFVLTYEQFGRLLSVKPLSIQEHLPNL